jgi:hypothetical protein
MMNCQTCLDVPECSNKASTLISGTTAFRNDTLTAHWKSKSHKASLRFANMVGSVDEFF